MILELKGIFKNYQQGKMSVPVLKDVNFSMEEGEYVAIMGPSGSGKTTLMNIIGCLDKPTEGKFFLDGQDILNCSENDMSDIRLNKIGFVFQAFNLVSSINVWENIVLPLGLDGKKVHKAYVNDIITTLGLEHRIHNLPNTLSGGQQQRVAIARALVNRPEILFADEPTGNLDSRTTVEVMGLLKSSCKKYSQTILMVTHNEALAQSCDRILHIEDGMLLPEKVMKDGE